jgi:ABC-type glycerol-3-phosphate transport system substrate-binding protein
MTGKRFGALLTALALTITAGPARSLWVNAASTAGESVAPGPVMASILAQRPVQNGYAQYIGKYSDAKKPLSELTYGVSSYENSSAEEERLWMEDGGTARFAVTPPEAGLYRLAVRYQYPEDGRAFASTVTVKINGELPFAEAEEIVLPQRWTDGEGIRQDRNGNDLKPTQTQVSVQLETELTDSAGYTRSFFFFLPEGRSEVELTFPTGELWLQGITFYNPEEAGYAAYAAEGVSQAEFVTYIQAETPIYKNDSSLTGSRDRTGPATMPSDPVKSKLNILGGASFNMPGQTVAYRFTVPEDGYYKLGFRYIQNAQQNVSVYRRVTVDGTLPFAEFAEVPFEYSDSWRYRTLGDGESPYLFRLTAGDHTVELETVTGVSGDIARRLEDAIYVLNYLYRKIIMITSTVPDKFRDYQLDAEIPELVPAFRELAAVLNGVVAETEARSGKRGGRSSILRQMTAQLEDFTRDTLRLPDRLEHYKNNVAAVSEVLLELLSQPLSIDYLTVSSAETEEPKTEAGFFESLGYHIRAFFGSFFNDYVYIGSSEEESGRSETIEVWFNGSREQAELIKQLIDSEFSPKANIGVSVKLVQIPLSQAVLAGTAPDVVMNVSRGQPVNLAARGVLTDLSGFDGFDETRGWFTGDAYLPYTYLDGVYGMPVTLDYHMLFYRTDILEELGLSVPQTWDDLYAILPILQRANMTVGFPYTAMNSQLTIDAGMGAKDIFPTLLLQRGGKYYNEDGLTVALDSNEAVGAFREWTELYTQYKMVLEYNFYNRFRTGEVPLGIQSYATYNLLRAAAPEINGLWGFTLIPGTLREDGSIDRTEAASGSAAVMLKGCENPEAAWAFIRWWTSADAQAAYGSETEKRMGKAARYTPANLEAMGRLPWKRSELATLREQMGYVREIEEIVGGYYTSRGIDNAFRSVLFDEENYRETLMEQIVKINDELLHKSREAGIKTSER